MTERIKVEQVRVGDTVLRYGMWFTVEAVETLPAAVGGDVVQLSLQPVNRGGACYLALYPGEMITRDTSS